ASHGRPRHASRERDGLHPRRTADLRRRRVQPRPLPRRVSENRSVIPAFVVMVTLLAATPADLPVEQTKKNIKVLQGLPSSQLIPVMAFMSNSLGVTCAHCHGKEWESDEKPAKDAARKMIALQRSLNEQHYGGKLVVTCNTCHAGHVSTAATPDLANAGWNATAPAVQTFTPGEEALAKLPAIT